MQRALTALGETRLHIAPLSLNMFAHFILIHTILRNIYAPREIPPDTLRAGAGTAARGESNKDNMVATQYALHNWLQMWLNSPESMQAEKNQEEPPFMCNAFPFYWLAQLSLLAIQDGAPIFDGGAVTDAKVEGRFLLMKEWLDHIKSFLRGGNQVPAHFWDQLMKIRGEMTKGEAQPGDGHLNGLLAFFSPRR